MSVKVTDNTKVVDVNLSRKWATFLRLFCDEVERNSDPITPMDTGGLRRDKIKQVLHATMSWGKSYAVYQEVKQYAHYTTAGTGPHYAEKGVRQAVNGARTLMRKVGL
jgi:hypothetical protein